MGAICHHKQDPQKSYTTRSISSSTSKTPQKIRITTKSLSKTTEQCLILFVDTQCNIRKNEFLAQLKPNVGSKLQDYLDVELKGKCMNPGDCLVLNVLVENLEYRYVGFLCISVWEGSSKGLQDPLQEDIQQAVDVVRNRNLGGICFTEFNTEFGVPLHVGAKALGRAILNKINDLNSVTIVCLKQEHQNAIIQAFRNQQAKRQGGGPRANSLVNSIKSDYY